jgi:iron(III) transport system permease protein
VFLYAPGNEIIGTTMLSTWAKGEVGPVAALSVIQLVLTLVLVGVLAYLGRGLPRAVEGD